MKLKITKTPRYYQIESVDSALKSIENPKSNPLIVLPTGSGKNLVISLLIVEWIKKNPNKNILVISHVKEILQQNYDELTQHLDEPIGVYAAGLNRKDTARVTIVSMQTGRNNPDIFKNIGLCIVDEAHLINSYDIGTYRKFLSNFNTNVIGLTATPFRSTGWIHKTEEALFTEICIDYTSYENFNKLTNEGYLAKIYSKATDFTMELQKGIRITQGDYNTSDLGILFNNTQVTEKALKEVKEIWNTGKFKKCLVFCIDIKHSELVAKMMNDIGIKTGFVHSQMKNCRFKEVEAFRKGELDALTNVNTLTTGLDIPDIDLLIMLRPTQSLSLYCQITGRLLRPAPNKEFGMILDFSGNISRLGPINDIFIDQKGKPRKGGEAPVKECPSCGCYNHPIAKFCIACSYKFKFKVKITTEASNLDITKRQEPQELTVRSVTYNRHKKKGKPDSLRIDYMVGLRRYHRWLAIESNSLYAADRAKFEIPKLLKDGENIDGLFTIDNIIKNKNKFKTPIKIIVDINEKYPQIEEIIYNED